ncbi:hypothetical protein MD484_g8187, partial [Candolleomyces efflorescens]
MSSGSPFARHLNTNYVPSAIEIHHIRSLADEQQKVVDALNVEIEALVKRRDEHAKFVKEHSALLSPVRRMPNDILSLIFLFCLPSNLFQSSPTKSGDHPALVISAVCQRWRHLSLDTPLLWTVIDIQVPWLPDPQEYRWHDSMAYWGKQVQAILARTQLWISRSANCPLTVSFSGGLTLPEDTDLSEEPALTATQLMRSLVTALCDVSYRWKAVYFSVEMGIDEAVNEFFQLPPDKIPLLETLFVNVLLTSPSLVNRLSQGEQLMEITTARELIKAPRLRRLGVGHLWSSPLHLPIKWANLTELSLGPLTYQTDTSFPLSILAMCVNLTRCSIHHQPGQRHVIPTNLANANVTTSVQAVNRHSRVFRLPRLRTLELRGYHPPPFLATNLDLPSLRELILLCSSPQTFGEGPEDGIFELVRKFGDSLTDFVFEWGSLTERSLLAMLRHLPNVVSLRLVWGIRHQRMGTDRRPLIGDSVLEKLSPQVDRLNGVAGGALCYCPKLQKFGCQVREDVALSEEAFARFVAARRHRQNASGVALLTSFVATFPSQKPNKRIRDWLEEMNVDLEDMILVAAYRPQTWHHSNPARRLPDLDADVDLRDHEDYVSTVGSFMRTLGGLTMLM